MLAGKEKSDADVAQKRLSETVGERTRTALGGERRYQNPVSGIPNHSTAPVRSCHVFSPVTAFVMSNILITRASSALFGIPLGCSTGPNARLPVVGVLVR